MPLTPIDIHSPGIIIIALLHAFFAHIYPKYILPHLHVLLSTTSQQRQQFEELYNKYREMQTEAEELDGNSALFAQYSLLKRQMIKLEIQLEKFPLVYYQWYSRKYNMTISPPNSRTNQGDTEQHPQQQQINQMQSKLANTATQTIFGFVPFLLLILLYIIILCIWGWHYKIYSFGDFSYLFDPNHPKYPYATNSTIQLNEQTSIFSQLTNIIWFLTGIFTWLPGAFLSTLEATTTSFFGLYYLFGRMIAVLIPLDN